MRKPKVIKNELEIEFRGKCLKTGKWVYGSLIKMDSSGSLTFIFPFYEHASTLSCSQLVGGNMVAVDPATVGRYTGFKDRSDHQKIYTGDILDCSYTNPMTSDLVKRLYVVEAAKGYFNSQRIGGHSHDQFPLFLREDKGIVIGNIHQVQDSPDVK